MPERGPRYHPEEDNPECAEDLAFIYRNLSVFWHISRLGYEVSGRGALVVDATRQNPSETSPRDFVYQPMCEVKHLFDTDVQHMVRLYDPAWEFVTVLFKGDREDTYRMRVLLVSPS